MINQFSYFTESDISLRIKLGVDVDIFEGNNESDVLSFFNGQAKGIKWFSKSKWISLFEQGQKLHGYPTSDVERVVVIYPMDHAKYRAPSNAVIYNADGSVHMQLKAPEPISELSKTQTRNMTETRDFNPPHRLYFDRVLWAKNNEGETITVVKIGFDRDWWEERELNPVTGEYGKCLGSGRR